MAITYSSYYEILREFGEQSLIPYGRLLRSIEWYKKRLDVLKRDHYYCRKCERTYGDNIVLTVHHLKYIEGKLPWDYSDADLVTLCRDCHYKIHLKNSIPVYSTQGDFLYKIDSRLTPCRRCKGIGILYKFLHVEAGVCFKCHGNCFTEFCKNVEVV